MSGQLLHGPASAPLAPHTHVRFVLGDDELRFVDPRTFGEVVVLDQDRLVLDAPDIAGLGVDPIADGLERRQLAAILRSRRRQLKALLLDQHVIAGLGNIYTDEILHRARLHPARLSHTVEARQVARLHDEIYAVLTAAIDAGGSTLADARYVDLMGEGGGYQEVHLVYGREGRPCGTCGRSIVRRVAYAGRSSFVCPRCQRAPR